MNLFIFPNLNANHNTKSKIRNITQKEMYIIINNHKD